MPPDAQVHKSSSSFFVIPLEGLLLHLFSCHCCLSPPHLTLHLLRYIPNQSSLALVSPLIKAAHRFFWVIILSVSCLKPFSVFLFSSELSSKSSDGLGQDNSCVAHQIHGPASVPCFLVFCLTCVEYSSRLPYPLAEEGSRVRSKHLFLGHLSGSVDLGAVCSSPTLGIEFTLKYIYMIFIYHIYEIFIDMIFIYCIYLYMILILIYMI